MESGKLDELTKAVQAEALIEKAEAQNPRVLLEDSQVDIQDEEEAFQV
jgi:hypothetical protein